jgi:calcineurin-like phosphoesterase family protein
MKPAEHDEILIANWNHDAPELLTLFDKAHGVLVKSVMGYHCVFTHIPIHPQEMYWDFNIHGHLHSNVVRKYANYPVHGKHGESDPRYICVSAEHMAFRPQPLDAVVEQRLQIYKPDIRMEGRR